MMDRPVTARDQDINALIAARVRSLRADHDLSLEELASRSGVSRSMLSLVERGESSPTAVVLGKIAVGLGVPLASLFNDATAPASPLSRAADRSTWRDPESGYVRCNISPPGFPSPLQIVEVVLPAGTRIAYDNGLRESAPHQQIWIQEGSVEVTAGRVIHRLVKGDCLAMKLDEPTAFRNRSRKPARYIVVIAA